MEHEELGSLGGPIALWAGGQLRDGLVAQNIACLLIAWRTSRLANEQGLLSRTLEP